MLNTQFLFEKKFLYKDLILSFLDFKIKNNLDDTHQIRGYAEVKLTHHGKETEEVFPILIVKEELFLKIDLYNFLIPMKLFVDSYDLMQKNK